MTDRIMRFAMLGPVEVWLDGRSVPLGGPKQRAVLAILLLHANRPVSRDQLIDALWGSHPPPSADASLDAYVYRLRKMLGRDRLPRQATGYTLRVEPGELDVDRFDSLVERAARATGAGDVAGGARDLREALALWRGPALADVLFEPFAGPYARELEERRLGALEDRIDADLRLGRGRELVPELGGPRRGESASRAPARRADARPLPVGTSGRSPGRVSGSASTDWRTSSAWIPGRSCATSSGAYSSTIRPSAASAASFARADRVAAGSRLPPRRRCLSQAWRWR